jgi:hypothetical protein
MMVRGLNNGDEQITFLAALNFTEVLSQIFD